jgi:hypothetical protein
MVTFENMDVAVHTVHSPCYFLIPFKVNEMDLLIFLKNYSVVMKCCVTVILPRQKKKLYLSWERIRKKCLLKINRMELNLMLV